MRFERFETPGGVSLQLALGVADADVSTWEHDATEVEIEAGRHDDATEALLAGMTIEHQPRGGGHVIVVREPKQRGFSLRLRGPSLRVRVRCPETSALTVAGGSTDVHAQGVFGSVEAKTGSGDVAVRGSAVSLRATSASGDVDVDRCVERVAVTTASGDVRVGRADGEVALTSVSGDIEVGDARAGAVVQSVSGDVTLECVRGGDVRVQTVSGDASVVLGQGFGVWLDVSSVSGDVDSDLELEDAPTGAETAAVIEVRAKSVSGDLHVTRATVVRP